MLAEARELAECSPYSAQFVREAPAVLRRLTEQMESADSLLGRMWLQICERSHTMGRCFGCPRNDLCDALGAWRRANGLLRTVEGSSGRA